MIITLSLPLDCIENLTLSLSLPWSEHLREDLIWPESDLPGIEKVLMKYLLIQRLIDKERFLFAKFIFESVIILDYIIPPQYRFNFEYLGGNTSNSGNACLPLYWAEPLPSLDWLLPSLSWHDSCLCLPVTDVLFILSVAATVDAKLLKLLEDLFSVDLTLSWECWPFFSEFSIVDQYYMSIVFSEIRHFSRKKEHLSDKENISTKEIQLDMNAT